MEDLANIYMTCGVNEKGEAFITVAAHGDKGTILVGQLDPEAVRQHGLAYLAVAEAAEQDAATLRVIQQMGIPEADLLAGMIVAELRNSKEGKLMAQSTIYIPDDLFAEVKRLDAPVSRIARQALEDWLVQNGDQTDPTAALRMIEAGLATLRTQIRDGAITATATKPRGGGSSKTLKRKGTKAAFG